MRVLFWSIMQTRTKLALASTIVPTLFLIRAVANYGETAAEHESAERLFEEHIATSQARQAEAGLAGTGKDTRGCVDWALARCQSPEGRCDACMDDLRGCLATANRNETYCHDVPRYHVPMPREDEARSTAWQKKTAAEAGLDDWTCQAMLKFVQLHCHPARSMP